MEHQINEEIRDKEVRLISQRRRTARHRNHPEGTGHRRRKGHGSGQDRTAGKAAGMQASWITANSAFEQAKREKEARKNQRVVEIKEIRLTPRYRHWRPEYQGQERLHVSSRTETRSRFRSVSAAVRSHIRRSVRTCSIALRSCARNAARWKSSPSSKAARCLCFWPRQKDK